MTTNINDLRTYPDLLQAVQPRTIRTEVDAAAMNDIVDLLTDRPQLLRGSTRFHRPSRAAHSRLGIGA